MTVAARDQNNFAQQSPDGLRAHDNSLLQRKSDHMLYLRCSVSQAVQRIVKQDRKAETNLGLGYRHIARFL